LSAHKAAEIRDWVREKVSAHRFRHIEGVVKTAVQLARRHGVSPPKAEWAAWLHDCGKELSPVQMKSWLRGTPFKLDRMEKTMPWLWHPHVGAAIARKRWGVRDKDILEAVESHTLGKPGMGKLAQILFVADFIEPGRKFGGIGMARKAAQKDLREGVLMKAAMTLSFLLEKNAPIHPRLVETLNSFR